MQDFVDQLGSAISPGIGGWLMMAAIFVVSMPWAFLSFRAEYSSDDAHHFRVALMVLVIHFFVTAVVFALSALWIVYALQQNSAKSFPLEVLFDRSRGECLLWAAPIVWVVMDVFLLKRLKKKKKIREKWKRDVREMYEQAGETYYEDIH